MCAIAGFAALSPEANPLCSPATGRSLKRMIRSLCCRGRDGEGVWVDQTHKVLLGHRRLAVADLTMRGHQPYEAAGVVLSYNGEIYNARELAQELHRSGYPVESDLDTQVLAWGYRAWGTRVFSRLRGMFACAIWDTQLKQLILVRDHFGLKPLYWTQVETDDGKAYAFASQLTALLASGYCSRVLNKRAVAHYLRHYHIQPPESLVEGIFSVPPGAFVAISSRGVSTSHYWRSSHIATNEAYTDKALVTRGVERSLHDALARQFQRAVPATIFLSGGVDSTVLAAFARNVVGQDIRAVTVGWDQSEDETDAARQIARSLNLHNHEVVSVTKESAQKLFAEFVEALDQPSGDGFNTFLAARAASDGSRVAYSGMGGDELFVGYRYMAAVRRYEQARAFMPQLLLEKAKQLCTRSSFARACAYRTGLAGLMFMPQRGAQLYRSCRSLAYAADGFEWPSSQQFGYDMALDTLFAHEPDLLNAYAKAELSWYIPGVLARDTDAVSMHYGLEVRSPFLDQELVEHLLSVPGEARWKLGRKDLLRATARSFTPAELLVRSPKRGFELPMGRFFNDKMLSQESYRWVLDRKVVDLDEYKLASARFEQDQRSYLPLWSLMVLNSWAERHKIESE